MEDSNLRAGRFGPGVWRYARFCIVGGIGLIVDMCLLAVLASPSGCGLGVTLSKAIAAEAAVVNNFLWNDAWTFRSCQPCRPGGLERLSRLIRFNLVCVTGIVLSVALLHIQVRWLNVNLYIANFVAVVAVSIWNFVLSSRFGWSPVRATAPGPYD